MEHILSLADFASANWAIIFAPVFVLLVFRRLTVHRPHFPPGPKGWPFIGNLLQMRSANPTEVLFQEWARNFGDITYIRVFSQPMLVLNSLDAVHDLLDKRGSIYSDRPRFVLFSELMGWQGASTHIRYGPRFRKHRRFIQQTFNQFASTSFHPLQERATLVLLDNLIQTPNQFVKHFKRFAASTIFLVTYGYDIVSADDEFVRLADEAATLTVETGTPAASLVDFFPMMKHIPTWAPFSGFKRKALETRKAVDKMMNVPFDMVKREMLSGQARPCFTSTLLETYCDPTKATPYSDENEADIKGAAGTLYAAAEDTTVCVMESFILAMVRHPEVLHKAQAEIDKVIGNKRLPNLTDRGSLPYLECVLNEVLRWNPPVPLGMPHRVMEDDSYHGYYIPKGATVLANIFHILHDCDEPNKFIPERYTRGLNSDLPDPREVVFGFGRRCPGRYFAEAGVWCMMANIIATLEIEQTPEDKGNKVLDEIEVTSSFVRHPKPFSCAARPRSRMAMTLIRDAKTYTEF